MILTCFLKAFLIGFSIAAPVGPIGMLCIRKTLEFGFLGAIFVGLGAALADCVYGSIAIMGLSAISNFLLANNFWIKIFGGTCLLVLAYTEFKKPIAHKAAHVDGSHMIKLSAGVFCLTLANPMTILSFLCVFASINCGPLLLHESLAMIFGIFCGAITWWCILGKIISTIQEKLSQQWHRRIQIISASMIAGFGLFTIIIALCGHH